MPEATVQRPRSSVRRGRLWLAGVLLGGVIAILIGLATASHAGADLPARLGYYLPIGAVIGGALHLLFRRKVTRATSWVAFFLIYAILVGASSFGPRRNKAELRQLAAELRESVEASARPASAAPVGPLVAAPTGDTEIARVGAVAKTLLNRVQAQRRDYEAELERLGWSQALDGRRLAQDPSLSASRALLRDARATVEKYRLKDSEVLEQGRRDIETSNLSAASREDMLRGLNRAIENVLPRAEAAWGLELQVVNQVGLVFDLLESRRGRWSIDRGQISFQQQADLDQFRALLGEVQKIAAQQEQLQKAQIDRARDILDRLGR